MFAGVDRVLTVLKENNFVDACLHSSYETIYPSPWAAHVDIEIQVYSSSNLVPWLII
jgi:hypothetical protein